MIINTIIFLLFAIGVFIYKTKKCKIKDKGKLINFKLCNEKVKENLQFLKPGKNQQEEIKKYYIKKLKIVFLIIFLFNVISFIANMQKVLSNNENKIINLERPLEGIKSYELSASLDELTEDVDIVIQVEKVWMNEKEVEEAFEKAYVYLSEVIIAENASLDEVSSNLYFPDSIPNTDISVTWETENYQYIDSFGNITVTDFEKDFTTFVRATLSYKGYKEEYQFYLKLVPEKLDTRSQAIKEINKLLIEEEKKQRNEDKVVLPKEVDGKQVNFYKPQNKDGQGILLMGLLLSIGIFILHDTKLSDEIQQKNKILERTYPEIVEKLTLLINAGMTIGRSWERMVLDYKKRGIFNYAYEEMEVTYYEIQKGQSEGKAYVAFGKRCKLHQYIKLGGLLDQNLKKGNKDLERLLAEEIREAFEDKKSRARQLGEEASTKLLMPMFLMLAVVLIICMAPAFMGF